MPRESAVNIITQVIGDKSIKLMDKTAIMTKIAIAKETENQEFIRHMQF